MSEAQTAENAGRRITRGIVPAAGIGSRLYPITRSQPKEMLPLGRKPTIQWAAEELVLAGISSVLFVTGENKRAVEDHFDSLFEDRSLRLMYIRQGGPRGLADAILCGDSFAKDESFVVALGDVVIVSPTPGSLLRRLCDTHVERNAAATIAVNPVSDEDTRKYGIISPAAESLPGATISVADLIEKPDPGTAPSNLAITGRYVLAPIAFEYIRRLAPGHGGELQLTDALQAMLRDGLPIYAEPLGPRDEVLDIGDIPGYWTAFMQMAMEDEELGEEMKEAARVLLERSTK
jgi:UTP--glucose-1-phosphate uridylyltransferase